VFLGEQIEAEIEIGRLPAAKLVPEAAAEGSDGATARVWVIEEGRLACRAVRVVARTLDARLALAPDAAGGLPIVTATGPGLAPGRRVVPAGPAR